MSFFPILIVHVAIVEWGSSVHASTGENKNPRLVPRLIFPPKRENSRSFSWLPYLLELSGRQKQKIIWNWNPLQRFLYTLFMSLRLLLQSN